jgi:hypothetical protein
MSDLTHQTFNFEKSYNGTEAQLVGMKMTGFGCNYSM